MLYSKSFWGDYIKSPEGKLALAELYPGDIQGQQDRYISALDKFESLFDERDVAFISAPGRTEIGGNHTDHQNGCVLAAAVSMDVIAAVAPVDSGIVSVKSEGYEIDVVDLNELNPLEDEKNCSASIIRGIAAGLKEQGYEIGGFNAYTTSDVPKGSGLSSSAAFEVLIGNIFNYLYNDGRIDQVTLAKTGQYSENKYFGKPCGLMDQTASSVGGIVTIDFMDPKNPKIENVPFDFNDCGYDISIVNAGGSHENLTDEYADITKEMKAVADYFGESVLRDVCPSDFYANITDIREKISERAVMRTMHFFSENDRVKQMALSLKCCDMERFKELVIMSGCSSFMQLQNAYPSNNTEERSVALALSLSENLLSGSGAWRIHGGGFAGTIFVMTPRMQTEIYRMIMRKIFGENSCYELKIRKYGGYLLSPNAEKQVCSF